MLRKILGVFKSSLAASGIEYALIVGLIAVVGIGAVKLTGERIREIFGGAGVDLVDSGATGQAPTVTLSASAGAASSSDTIRFSWTVTDTSSISAHYRLSGACPALADEGSGPHYLPWGGKSGAAEIAWALDIAGCSLDTEMTASNAAGKASDSESVAYAAPDVTPEFLAFAAVTGAEPGSRVSSPGTAVSNIEAPATIMVGAGDARISIAGDVDLATSLTVASGAEVQLHADAPADFNATRAVPFSAGEMSGSWVITTRQADTSADAFDFGIGDQALNPGEEAFSSLASFTGFEIPLDLVITPSLNANAGTLAYSRDSGPWINLANNSPVILADRPENATLRFRLTAAATYQVTAQTASVDVEIGGKSDSWTAGLIAQDRSANAFTFTDHTGLASSYAGTLVQTGPVSLTGFNGTLNLALTPSGGSGWQYYTPATGWKSFSGATTVVITHASTTTVTQLYLRMNAPAAGASASILARLSNSDPLRQDYWNISVQALSCAASTVGWQTSYREDRQTIYNNCSGPVASAPYNTTVPVNNTADGKKGSASFVCSNGAWVQNTALPESCSSIGDVGNPGNG